MDINTKPCCFKGLRHEGLGTYYRHVLTYECYKRHHHVGIWGPRDVRTKIMSQLKFDDVTHALVNNRYHHQERSFGWWWLWCLSHIISERKMMKVLLHTLPPTSGVYSSYTGRHWPCNFKREHHPHCWMLLNTGKGKWKRRKKKKMMIINYVCERVQNQ